MDKFQIFLLYIQRDREYKLQIFDNYGYKVVMRNLGGKMCFQRYFLDSELDKKRKKTYPHFHIWQLRSKLNLWTMHKKSLDKSTRQIKLTTMDKRNILRSSLLDKQPDLRSFVNKYKVSRTQLNFNNNMLSLFSKH